MDLTFSELQDLIRVRANAIWGNPIEYNATIKGADRLIEAARAYKKFLVASKKSKGTK